jgi:hypothetical protein
MMLPLSDASNHQQQAFTATAAAAAVGGASKRPRLSQLAPADATFAAVVSAAVCVLGHAATSAAACTR